VLHGRIYRDGPAEGFQRILITFCLVPGGIVLGIQMTQVEYDILIKYKCVWPLGQSPFAEQSKASPQSDAPSKSQPEAQTKQVVDLTTDVRDIFTIITLSF
jgi:hypothetical protein